MTSLDEEQAQMRARIQARRSHVRKKVDWKKLQRQCARQEARKEKLAGKLAAQFRNPSPAMMASAVRIGYSASKNETFRHVMECAAKFIEEHANQEKIPFIF